MYSGQRDFSQPCRYHGVWLLSILSCNYSKINRKRQRGLTFLSPKKSSLSFFLNFSVFFGAVFSLFVCLLLYVCLLFVLFVVCLYVVWLFVCCLFVYWLFVWLLFVLFVCCCFLFVFCLFCLFVVCLFVGFIFVAAVVGLVWF